MIILDTGTYGAKVQSWRRANPRDLLKSLIEANPAATKTDLLKLFRDELRGPDGEDHLDSVIEYWFANNYHSLIERPTPEASARERQDKIEAVKEKVTRRIREEAHIILLEMILPNGKALRDCTGSECGKVGGWLTKIAAKVKPNEIVGDVLDEDQVRKLYGC